MPAYFDTGFSVRQPMWHGLGTVADTYPESWDEARMMAGLMWEPEFAGVYDDPYTEPDPNVTLPDTTKVIATNPDGSRICLPTIEGFRRVRRDDTKATLAVPTDTYELIYHHQMGELLEAYSAAWRKEGATMKFETAGSVKGGAAVWALVYLDEPWTAPGDDSATYPFAALLNSHDGSGACKLTPTSVRVVCWNTFQAAMSQADRTAAQVILRHAGNVEQRIEDAKVSLTSVRSAAKAWQMEATDLAGININDAVVRTFLDEFMPVPDNATERTRNNRTERQATFMRLYTESPTCADLPDTAYKLVQAAGEYLDHLRPFRSQDTYLSRTMLHAEPIKSGAIQLVRDIAKDLVPA